MISYEKARKTLGPRVWDLRQADPNKDFWKALDRAIAEVGGIEYGPNQTRTKLAGELSSELVQRLPTPGELDSWS